MHSTIRYNQCASHRYTHEINKTDQAPKRAPEIHIKIHEYESPGASRNEKQSETKQKHLVRGSEYVVTYLDKDGERMLLGDVPWEKTLCVKLDCFKNAFAHTSDNIDEIYKQLTKSNTYQLRGTS
ncbi:auxin-responsive protein IAA8-like protein isoform X2 [Tanacetum coccineum]